MEQICIIDEEPTNLQQLRDVIASKWTKIAEDLSNTLGKVYKEK